MDLNGTIDEEVEKFLPWAFTVKKLGPKEVSPSDYAHIIKTYNRFGTVEVHEYEKDSKGKLHVHGIVILPRYFLRKRLIIHGYSLKLVTVYNKAGWMRYIKKDQPVVPARSDQHLISAPDYQHLDPADYIPDDKETVDLINCQIATLKELLGNDIPTIKL